MSGSMTAPSMSANDIETQIAFFREHSYVILPDILTIDEVAAFHQAVDRALAQNTLLQYCPTSQDYRSYLLSAEPIFDTLIRHPGVLPLVEHLMGDSICFEELEMRYHPPERESRYTGWHRDCSHWLEHPLHLDYLQVLYYLTDVDGTTHCFTLSPEPAEGEVLGDDLQLTQRGAFHYYGSAGSAIVFNAAVLHGATIRQSTRHRCIVQVYYGHPLRPLLSGTTLIPPRLWRDHPEAEVRRFYSKCPAVLQ